ncbi:MAG: hypothetical protein ACOWWH_10125 [Eubacteriaceae bacterium]
MKKKIIVLLFYILIIVFNSNVCADTILYDEYQTDLGLTIKSYAKNWTGHKLTEVYEELKKNTYGEEIKHLKEINLYEDNPTGGKEEGVYNASYKIINFFGNEKIVLSDNNSIDLYNLSDKNNVEELAKTLSHEYGHHFTLFYLIEYENKTFDQWKDTMLYKYRNLESYEKVTNDYENGHQWSIIEICAEDYVQLYGSLTAKKVYFFEDIKQRYYSNALNDDTSYSYSIFNINPQENTNIPLALQVEGLKEYWEKASGIISDTQTYTQPQLALVDISNLGHDKQQYTLQWGKSINSEGEEAEFYTLISLNIKEDRIIPIKTVVKGDPLEATIGSIRINSDSKIMFYTDSFVNNDNSFVIYSIDKNGSVIASNILDIDFDNPALTNLEDKSYFEIQEKDKDINIETQNIKINEGNEFIDEILDYIFIFIEKIFGD